MTIPSSDGYYIYIIKCKNNAFYTGWTTNIPRRFYAHAIGKGAKYTRAHRPLELHYFETLIDEQSARKRECEIKKLTHQQKSILKRQ